jgi:hypothetical protein
MYVVERDSSLAAGGKKFIFKIDINGATNLLDPGYTLLAGTTLEQHSADDLVSGLPSGAVVPVNKVKVTNLPSIGYLAGDKPEGLALLDDGRLAVLNDNDFGLDDVALTGDGNIFLQPEPVPVVLGVIDFTQENGLDASDRDNMINVAEWPVFGMYMPDGVASYTVGGQQYFVTANEGDSRDYDEVRIDDLELNASVFDASLLEEENLGRLACSIADGDIDPEQAGYEQLHVYGARSLSIWDAFGNLVYDSGSLLEDVTAMYDPWNFNSTNDENLSFDTRSDAKGPEPEDVVVGQIGDDYYAFLGLERIGGIFIMQVTDPSAPVFVDYVNNRDFIGNAELGLAGDLGPEGLEFVAAEDSPTGHPLLIVGNEVSGTTTVYTVNIAP